MNRSEEIRAILGISRAEFSRRYNIPVRTLENWDAGIQNPPEYVYELLERAVKEDAKK
jgi:DNA-binding transcriptional regulator YiaG